MTYLVSGLYARGELYDQARSAVAKRKAQASHRAVRKGAKAGAVTILRPDASGELREVSVDATSKRVRWDVAGLYVERAE